MFEPVHGSAPDIAGKNLADPGATIAALRMAGGFSAVADRSRLAVERLQGKLGLRMSKGDAPLQLELKSAAGDVLVFASTAPPASKPEETTAEQANQSR